MAETFAEEVRRRREAAGLTQLGLAELAGLSHTTVKNIEAERGNAPYDRTVASVRAALVEAEKPRQPEGIALLIRVREFLANRLAEVEREIAAADLACPRCAGSPPQGFICAACGARNETTGDPS